MSKKTKKQTKTDHTAICAEKAGNARQKLDVALEQIKQAGSADLGAINPTHWGVALDVMEEELSESFGERFGKMCAAEQVVGRTQDFDFVSTIAEKSFRDAVNTLKALSGEHPEWGVNGHISAGIALIHSRLRVNGNEALRR